MDENKKTKLESFKNLNIYDENYTKKEMLGINSFSDQVEILNNSFKYLIDECVKIILIHNYIPERLIDLLIRYIDDIQSILNDMAKYRFDTDVSNNMNTRREIIGRVNNLVNQTYAQERPNNFLQIYSAIKSFGNDALNDIIKNSNLKVDEKILEIEKFKSSIPESLSNLKTEFDNFKKEGDTVLNALQKKAATDVMTDYSIIFKEQANGHSNLGYKFKMWSTWGSAEKWMLISILFIILLGVFLWYSHEYLPVTELTEIKTIHNDSLSSSKSPQAQFDKSINIGNIIYKISVLTILFFLIKFSTKQYSINKHLHTLNKHRENTLISFKLFIASLSNDDLNTKNIIMAEVAKAIYDNSKSGYISEKDGDSSSLSIVEKIVSKNS